MPSDPNNLQFLTSKLLEEVRTYGILEVSMEQYETTCRTIVRFAEQKGTVSYSAELMDAYREHLQQRNESKEICREYKRFQERVVRMLSTLAETGSVDFSPKKPATVKYPVSEETAALVEDILKELHVSDKTRSDLRAPVRHIFWYAHEHGVASSGIDDSTIMGFIIDEVPVSNSGSTGRTLRCVKIVTEYLKSHGNKRILHDYRMLTLKNSHRRIIPAFSEEEIRDMSAAVDVDSPLGKRDYAIILLAYCSGLRGVDIVFLKLSDIDWRKQKVHVSQSKTHVPLSVELNGQTMNALADYVLEARPECDVPEVFVTANAPYRRLSSGFGHMIDKYCKRASVCKVPFRAFHSLRRSFETVMVSHGVPIETASRMMGHKNISEEKPYITHNKAKVSFVAMDFSHVPIKAGIYAKHAVDATPQTGGGDA